MPSSRSPLAVRVTYLTMRAAQSAPGTSASHPHSFSASLRLRIPWSYEHEPWRSANLSDRRDLNAQHSDRAMQVTPLATDVTVGTSTNEDDISSTGAPSGRLNGDRINSNDQVAVKFAIAGHGTAPDISVPSDGARTASSQTMPPARARRRQESTLTIDHRNPTL